MIVDKIKTYLYSGNKTYSQSVIDQAYLKFKNSVTSQFMKNREPYPSHIYTTLVTKKCARQSAYTYHGFQGEPLSDRVMINFFTGDIIELTILMLAELAGVKIESNNEHLTLEYGGQTLTNRPDGIFFDGKEWFNVEIKKMSDYAYDSFEREGLDDSWGYETQQNIEIEAWRQNKKDVSRTIFIGIKGLTGNFCEKIIDYKPELVKALFERIKKVKASTKDNLPERAYKPEIETYYKKPTGNLKLPIFCSYCSFKAKCWPDFKLEYTKSGNPVWRKPIENE